MTTATSSPDLTIDRALSRLKGTLPRAIVMFALMSGLSSAERL